MKTPTEKYHAVLKGELNEGEFVRQMRLAYPSHITQFNGYDDTVQILRNRGFIFEKAEEEATLEPSPENIQRGTRAELNDAGIDIEDVTEEDFEKAEAKAIKNIKKDYLYYYNVLANAGKKSKKDKEVNKPKEVKRGSEETDKDNAMEKVSLKEQREVLKESIISCIEAIKAKYGNDGDDMIRDFIKMHGSDIAGMSPEQCVAEYEEFRLANLDSLEEGDKPDYLDLDKDGDREESMKKAADDKEAMKEGQYFGADGDDIIELIKQRALNNDSSEIDEAMEVMEFIGQEYKIDFEFGAGQNRAFEGNTPQEKMLKEGMKKVIKSILSEGEEVNELDAEIEDRMDGMADRKLLNAAIQAIAALHQEYFNDGEMFDTSDIFEFLEGQYLTAHKNAGLYHLKETGVLEEEEEKKEDKKADKKADKKKK